MDGGQDVFDTLLQNLNVAREGMRQSLRHLNIPSGPHAPEMALCWPTD